MVKKSHNDFIFGVWRIFLHIPPTNFSKRLLFLEKKLVLIVALYRVEVVLLPYFFTCTVNCKIDKKYIVDYLLCNFILLPDDKFN